MPFDNQFSKLTNGVLWYQGQCTYGKTEEINNPEIVAKMIDHKVAGMAGSVKLPSGWDQMEASFKLNGPLDEIARDAANVKAQREFMFRGSVEGYKGQSLVSERSYVAIWRGTFTNSGGGAIRQHENVELNYKVSCTYYKLTIDGKTIHEIDFINNIVIVGGVDLLANYKANLGI